MTSLQFIDERTGKPIRDLPVRITGEVQNFPDSTAEASEERVEPSEIVTETYLTDGRGKVADQVYSNEPIVAGEHDRRYRTIRFELEGSEQTIELARGLHTVTF
jgi:hypothetical protein